SGFSFTLDDPGPADVSRYERTGRWPKFLVGGRGAGRRAWSGLGARSASVRRSSVHRPRSGTPVLAGRGQPTSQHSRSGPHLGISAWGPVTVGHLAYNRRTRKSSKEIREAVSDRGRGVRSRGERPPTRAPPTNEKGRGMRKLTTITMVTVDGVMQGLGGPDEDRSGGFERGGWVTHSFDNEAMAFLSQVYERADAFLFGARTYED